MVRSIKLICSLVLILLPLLLGGCAFKDIDKRIFITSIGVDVAKSKKKKMRVTLKLAVPSGDVKMGKSEFLLISEDADSISEAVRELRTRIAAEVDFSHTKVILFGEKFVKENNMQDNLFWFLRRNDLQMIAWVAVGKPTAYEIMKAKVKSERIPSNALFLTFGMTGNETPYTYFVYIHEFYRLINDKGTDASLPVIEVKKDDLLEVNNVIIFKGTKGAFILTPSQSIIFNYLRKRIEDGNFKIIKNGKMIYMLKVNELAASYDLKESPGKPPKIEFRLTVEGTVEEVYKRFHEYQLEGLEQMANEEVKQRVIDLLKLFQEKRVDPLGFSMKYRSKHFYGEQELTDWNSVYPDVTFDVKVDTNIQGLGIIE